MIEKVPYPFQYYKVTNQVWVTPNFNLFSGVNAIFGRMAWVAGLLLLMCSSCNMTKSLQADETLYNGSEIVYQKKDKKQKISELDYALQSVIENPQANKKILGWRWKVGFYHLFYTEKEKGLKQWLMKKLGNPPVLYEEGVTTQTEELIKNRAINNGYFDVDVTAEATTKKRLTSVDYVVSIRDPYVLDTIKNSIQDSIIALEVKGLADSTLLKSGQRYDLAVLKQERLRIASKLREEGFFYFRDDYLLFRADTLQGGRKIQVELFLKEKTPERSLVRQKIRKVIVHPDFDLKRPANFPLDSLRAFDMKFLYEDLLLDPNELDKAIVLKENEVYNAAYHQKTLERLTNMQMYQYIDVQFKKVKGQEALMDVEVFLTPRKPKTISGSIGMSYTNNLSFGPEVTVNHVNRNLFGGAEVLTVSGKVAYNFPLADLVLTTQEEELNIELTKPRVWFPVRQILESKRLVGETVFNLNFSREKLQLPLGGASQLLEEGGFDRLLEEVQQDSSFVSFVSLNSVSFIFGYRWRREVKIRHQFNPIDVELQFPNYESQDLREFLVFVSDGVDDGDLGLNLERMILYKPNYTFTFDSRFKSVKRHNYFYRGKVGYSINKLLNQDKLIDPDRLEGDFLFLENDFRYFLRQNDKTTFAFRFSPSVAYPIQNEVILPFFDLFVVGGPNSVRAFAPRGVGPGASPPLEENFLFRGVGDIKLESSIEIRQKISSIVELALFADAGNTWLFEGDGDSDPAKFDWNDFYQELATGVGFGMRFDFSVLLIRLDLAHPITIPWQQDKMAEWKLSNLNFNLAFGYPF